MRRVSIIQGEYAVLDEPGSVIVTILGSCVSVCLFDRAARLGGMKHFLLGRPAADQQVAPQDMHRYGVHAMELLINELMRRGADRGRLTAHLYGGANIVSGLGRIGSQNAEFAVDFLRTEGVPVAHTDLGGTEARKVEFMPHDGRARCTHVKAEAVPVEPVRAPPLPEAGEVELF